MKRTRQRKQKIFSGNILLLISLVLFGAATIFFQKSLEKIPNSILFIPSSEISLSAETLKPTGKGILSAGICCDVETPLGKAEVIDQTYQELDALQIKDGKKMDFTAPQVLLSQSLAKELGKQPGDSLEVGEQTYSITGVFQEQSSVLHFIPPAEQKLIFSQSPVQEELLVSKILFWNENNSFLYARDSSYELDGHYGQTFHGKFHNIALMKRTIKGISFFFLFLLVLPFLWSGIVFSWKLLVKAYTDSQKPFFYRVFFIASGILLVIVICSAWCWLFGKMIPPRQYLPPEQIFDGYYYINEIKNFYGNTQGECGTLFSFRILTELPIMQSLVYILCVGIFWGSLHWMKKCILHT